MKRKVPVLFYQFLLSYLVTLLIPVAVLVYLVYGRFVSVIEDEVDANLRIMLTSTMEAVDERLRDLRRIAFQISTHPQLTPFAMTRSPAATMAGMAIMNDMRAGTEFFTDVILLYSEVETLYAATGTYSGRTLFGEIIKIADITPDDLLREFRTSTVPVVVPLRVGGLPFASGYMLAVSYPVPLGSRDPSASVVFLISELTFRRIMAAGMRYPNGDAIIYDSEGRQIASLSGSRSEPSGWPGASADAGPRGMLTSSVVSSESGWSYYAAVPAATALAPVITIQALTLAGLLATALLGIVAIVATMRVNYSPLTRIRSLIGPMSGSKPGSRWDYGTMERAIDALVSEHRHLDADVAESLTAIRQHLLVKILKGQGTSDERTVAALERAGLPTARHFAVAVVSLVDGDQREPPTELLYEQISRSFRPAIAWSVPALQSDAIIVLLVIDADPAEMRSVVVSGHLRLTESFGAAVTVGVGGECDGLDRIPRSYLEARTALDYRIVVGTSRIIWFDDVSSQHGVHAVYPQQEILGFQKRLRMGDGVGVRASVAEIARTIAGGGATLYMARCVASELLSTVIRTLLEMGWPFERIVAEYPNVMSLADVQSTEELSRILRSAGDRLCAVLAEGHESGNTALRDELVGHLEVHYGDASFSIQAMAAAFGLSASYVSRFLKDQLGVSARDYIQRLRMDRAKELLRTTELTINEIVEQIGYWDSTSFIKRFKAIEEMTPGAYRDRFSRRSN